MVEWKLISFVEQCDIYISHSLSPMFAESVKVFLPIESALQLPAYLLMTNIVGWVPDRANVSNPSKSLKLRGLVTRVNKLILFTARPHKSAVQDRQMPNPGIAWTIFELLITGRKVDPLAGFVNFYSFPGYRFVGFTLYSECYGSLPCVVYAGLIGGA